MLFWQKKGKLEKGGGSETNKRKEIYVKYNKEYIFIEKGLIKETNL